MADIPVRIALQTIGGASAISVIGNLANALKSGLGGALLGVAAAAAGTAIAIGVQSVQAFTQYRQAMVQLQNTTGSSDAQMRQYEATIKQLSDTTGKSQADLAAGMYQIISANFFGADATQILTTATQAAVIANANQTQVTTGLIVTLNAFGQKADQANTVSNQMFKTLSLGRGNISDLSGSLQTGASLVHQYGVNIVDMDATLATLSTSGMKTFGTSMTALTQLLNVMDGKTDLITKRLHAQGIQFDESKFKSMNYVQQIQYLNQAFAGHGDLMVSVLGSKQAADALGMLGDHVDLLKSDIAALGNTQQLAKDKQDAWARTQQTSAFQAQLFQTHIQNLMITLGANLLPIINNVIAALMNFGTWVGTVAGGFIDWVQKSNILNNALNTGRTAVQDVRNTVQGTISVVQNIAGWFVQWHTPILAVAGAITLFFLPAIIKAGVEATVAGGKIATGFIANLVKTGVESVVNGAKLTAQFVASMVKSGVEAVVNGAKITAQFVSSIIKAGIEGWQAAGKLAVMIAQFIASGVQAALAGAKIAAQLIASIVKTGISSVITAGQFVASLIPAIASTVAEALIAAATAIPGLIAGFVGWAISAGAAAIAQLALVWPILAVVAAIGIIIVVIVLLWTHWQQIWGAIVGIAHWAWNGITSIFGGIGNWFHQQWQKVQVVFSVVGQLFHQWFQSGLDAIVGVFIGIDKWFLDRWNAVVAIFSNIKSQFGQWFQDAWNVVVQLWNAAPDWFRNLFTGIVASVKNIFGTISSAIGGILKGAINLVIIDPINGIISAIDSIHVNTPFGSVGFNIPHIPQLASGGTVLTPGLALVGERGPELLSLPQGATVSPLSRGDGAGGPVTNIYVTVSTLPTTNSTQIRQMVTMIAQEMGKQFRGQTPGYNSGLVF